MNKLDLIIDALEVSAPSWNYKKHNEALVAAHELREAVEKINKENKDRKDAAWCIAYDLYGG